MVAAGLRMTIPTQLVLQALLQDPTRELYGVELGDAAGLASGTVHPILARFESLGWLDSAWEQVDPREQGRPRRRYYRLNANGIAMARDALARAYETRTRIVGRLRPAGDAV